MTDRELLEAAAKAAGITIDKSEINGVGAGNTGFDLAGNAVLDWHNGATWNPLIDDGDALRLAVKLRISLTHEEEYMGGPVMETIEATTPPCRSDGARHCEMLSLNDQGDDAMANTRRAIVGAAAALAGPVEQGERA